ERTRLGRYEIRSKIGEGGMGEVYLAQDTKLDRKVALKILPAELAGNQDRMRRFTQEAKAAAALNHPNIAHIYEVDQSDGTSFIEMEFIDGVTLREKWVAFRGEEQEKYFLWVEQVSTKTVRPLVQTTEGGFGTSFSADSEFVYYSLFDQGHPKGTLLQIPILGGTPRRILDDIDSAAVFSRDGKRLAFVRLDKATGKSTLMVANADGSDQKEVASRQRPESFPSEGPSWSPDGKRIATGVNKLNSTGTVIEVPVDGGPEKSLTSQKWPHVFRVAWLSDGSGLVVTAYPTEAATGTQLWFIAQPSGDVSQI